MFSISLQPISCWLRGFFAFCSSFQFIFMFSIQKKLSSTPPLELFDESVFKELVKKVLISNTAIQFELINGMKLSESRAAT